MKSLFTRIGMAFTIMLVSFSGVAKARPACEELLSSLQTSTRLRSETAKAGGLAVFVHATIGDSLLEILKHHEISSFNRAISEFGAKPKKYNGDSDLVYVQGRQDRSRSQLSLVKKGVFLAPADEFHKGAVEIFLKPSIIDQESFAWVNRGWQYGAFQPRYSYERENLKDFFANKAWLIDRNEFLFHDKLEFKFEDIEVIMVETSAQRDFFIQFLKQNYGLKSGSRKWEDLIRTNDQRTYVTDPRKLADDYFLTQSTNQDISALYQLDATRALRLARALGSSPRGFSMIEVHRILEKDDFPALANIMRKQENKMQVAYANALLTKIKEKRIEMTEPRKSFLAEYKDQSIEIRKFLDPNDSQAYLDENYIALIQNEKSFVANYSELVWSETVKSALVTQLKTRDDDMLAKLGMYTMKGSNFDWLVQKTIDILQERGNEKYVRLIRNSQQP